MDAPLTIRIFGEVSNSIVDGVGLRYGVFVQGCSHACPGCHNKESWPAQGGTENTIDEIFTRIAKSKLDQGVTLSGGEPFEQAYACAQLARRIKEELGRNLWIYTGYLYEDIASGNLGSDAYALLSYADVLVDGPFVRELKSEALQWKGSSNQRVIDVVASREKGSIVLWEKVPSVVLDEIFTKPQSW